MQDNLDNDPKFISINMTNMDVEEYIQKELEKISSLTKEEINTFRDAADKIILQLKEADLQLRKSTCVCCSICSCGRQSFDQVKKELGPDFRSIDLSVKQLLNDARTLGSKSSKSQPKELNAILTKSKFLEIQTQAIEKFEQDNAKAIQFVESYCDEELTQLIQKNPHRNEHILYATEIRNFLRSNNNTFLNGNTLVSIMGGFAKKNNLILKHDTGSDFFTIYIS